MDHPARIDQSAAPTIMKSAKGTRTCAIIRSRHDRLGLPQLRPDVAGSGRAGYGLDLVASLARIRCVLKLHETRPTSEADVTGLGLPQLWTDVVRA